MMELKDHLKEFSMKNCPIDNSLKIFGKKFTCHIIRNMILLKQHRFSEFLKSIEGISTKTLSIRLQEMEKEGLITREVIDRRPLQVEYSLTKKGKDLEPLLVFLGTFSMKYDSHKVFKDKKPRTTKQTFGTEILSEIYD